MSSEHPFPAAPGWLIDEVSCAGRENLDVSDPMLDRLQAKVADAGVDNVEVSQAGFLTYEHVGDPADFIYSRYALHHLPDFWKAVALDRLRQMIRPGGIFRLWDVVYDFASREAGDRIEAWCATGGDTVEVEWSRTELEEHVRDEHSEDGIFAKYPSRHLTS